MTTLVDKNIKANYLDKNYVASLSGMTTIEVTPKMAEQWLKWNTTNRHLKENHFNQLVRRMEKGEWMLNGQALLFGSNGSLLDGQHRLSAVVKYGKPVLFDVRFGLDPTAFTVIDDGMKRNPGDVLEIEQVPYAKTAAAAVKMIINYINGQKDPKGNNYSKPSNLEILEFYREHPKVADSVASGQHWYNLSDRLLTGSDFAMFYFLMRRKNEKKALEFLQGVADGVGLQLRSPIYQLRKRLISFKMDKMVKVKRSVKVGLVVKAWNLFLLGKEIAHLSYSPREKENRII